MRKHNIILTMLFISGLLLFTTISITSLPFWFYILAFRGLLIVKDFAILLFTSSPVIEETVKNYSENPVQPMSWKTDETQIQVAKNIGVELLTRSEYVVTVKKDDKELTSTGKKSSGRVAYLFEDFVVKFGDHGNRKELALWEIIEEDDRKYFSAIFGFGTYQGQTFLIEERVFTDFDAEITDEHHAQLKRLKEKYGLWDMNLENLGYMERTHNATIDRDGNLKIFDFACSRLVKPVERP